MTPTNPTPAPAGVRADFSGFTLDQCRAMAQEAKIAREGGSLRPMAEFDPERILWLIDEAAQFPALRAAVEKALAAWDGDYSDERQWLAATREALAALRTINSQGK